ncbi:unnamed protein product [Clonostachys chloroleuca]|uniref:Succinate dehydrogenase cytochrome b subunit n=1 Tax=Clonostachys chloroleuca TaxID=1926264 RepID=A0AA35LTL1_9HYPO|nr:unnamed protein product [Clonostachys chloroleuca]
MFTIANRRINAHLLRQGLNHGTLPGPLPSHSLDANDDADTRGGLSVSTSLLRTAIITSLPISSSTTRPVATQKIDAHAADEILVRQRLQRPVAPHLTVYQVNQTWTGSSIWMRFTGVGVMGVAYGYFMAYALNPLVGWNLGSESLIATFATMSPLAKGSIKFGLSWPFVFHFVNGIKQLVYDMGIGYGKRTIEASNNWPFIIGVFGALVLTFAL